MQVPFTFDSKAVPFTIPSTATVADLMEKAEEEFESASNKEGKPHELQINVLWNTKDHKKALNPNDKASLHFATGETFGIYGDIMPSTAHKEPVKEEDKTPVLILTGFLGSGKTTLLNYILQEQKERKIAVIENEFGEISIDDELLKQDKLALAEKVIVMDNGCMCCTVRDDLEKGLKQIMETIDSGHHIDEIIIETTGMADPVPIVRTFMTNPDLTERLRLDGVVVLADCKNLIGRLDDKVEEGKVNEAYQQIAFGDKIILNKLDLVTTDEAIIVKDRIRDINKFAKICPAIKGRVKMAELINLNAHNMVGFVDEDISKEAEVPKELQENGHGDCHEPGCTEGHGHGHGHGHAGHGDGHGHDPDCKEDHGSGEAGHGTGHGHGHSAKKSRHDSRVNSMSIVKEGEILPKKLSAWMQSLGQIPAEKGVIFRIKAILAVKGHPFKHVFHAVMDVSDEEDAGPWAEGEKKISKIVFIGKGLDEGFLREGFEAIFE